MVGKWERFSHPKVEKWEYKVGKWEQKGWKMGKGRKMGTALWDSIFQALDLLRTKGRKMGKRSSLALYDYYAAFLCQNLPQIVLHAGFCYLAVPVFVQVIDIL